MTETRLRTYTHLAGYLLTALFVASLAIQNLRYGFYDQFYLAAGVASLMVGGAVYTLACRRQQLRATGHLLLLTTANAVLVIALFSLKPVGLSHWAMPLLVLNILILPLRQGLCLCLLLYGALALFLLTHQSPVTAIITLTAGFLLISVATLYIWHYDHMAQSAEDLAITDPVTGAHNARFLDETLNREISRAEAMGHPLSCIALGIDYAQEIEDLHDRDGLQQLLRNLTRHLFGVVRAGDTLYAFEQGKFFLILPFTPEEGVRVIAERIRRTIAENHWPDVGTVTVSLGCTSLAAGDTLPEMLRRRAEQALELARQQGQDSVWFSQGETTEV